MSECYPDWNYPKHGKSPVEQERDALKAEAQALREEVARKDYLWQLEMDRAVKAEQKLLEQGIEIATLRARVVVVPERKNMAVGFDGQRTYAMAWNACLDELARLNGKAVSEGLLRSAYTSITELILSAQTRPSCQKGMVDPCRCHRCNVERALKVDAELRALLGEGTES